ncbi:acetyl-coa acetyltransferase cytosolic [Anaeramoeba ignava]|uniref:Acetyl-coa acetyltransferase cytosolic n=1 Tax=Anaeramoeba ignava TaxID=1746090 RepID=A0A9Q0RF91_ANAIG|nr:acetyl-coa acetyltransferase cytosolic [Anaeramoeba ignava]
MENKNNVVVIVSAVRTPIGGFNGVLSKLKATELGSIAIKGALEKANIKGDQVNEVFFGNVLPANLGQGPARIAALGGGIPSKVPCTTVNKVCSSGMKAVTLGAQQIMLGGADVVVAGGMESMSNVPYYLDRNGFSNVKMGNKEIVDGMIQDGLWDSFNNFHMGLAGELCAEEMKITREEQDAYAIESYKKAKQAFESKMFDTEIIPVKIPLPKRTNEEQKYITITEDEEYTKLNEEKLKVLRTAFKKDGTITAANASTISDGAAAVVLMSEATAIKLGAPILARIISFADAAQEPEKFPTSPSLSIKKALDLSPFDSLENIDFFEINEAFSVVVCANQKLLSIPKQKINVFGGAVSLGHPIGCSGARILVTLINVLHKKNAKIGCAAICNGGGGSTAMIIERV